MKKYLMLSVVLLAVSSCSKDGNNNNIVLGDVNSLVVNVSKVNTPVAPDSGNYSVWFSMAGNSIYYVIPSNIPNPQFMLSYDITTNMFTPKTVNSEICACGYVSKITSNGTDLYYFGNNGVKFNTASNTWSALNFPTNIRDQIAGSSPVYFNNRIYFAGGIDGKQLFKYYDIAADNWFSAADLPYPVAIPQLVVVNDKIYALGGDENGTKFSVYSENEGWKELSTLPFSVYDNRFVNSSTTFKGRYIFAAEGNAIQIYDTATGQWRVSPIEMNDQTNYRTFFEKDNILYLAAKTYDNDFSLHKITVSN